MTGIRHEDINQTIRDIAGDDLTDEQVTQIRQRAYLYDGTGFVEASGPEEFWRIVEDVSTTGGHS